MPDKEIKTQETPNEIIEKIYRHVLKDVDTLASYHHYLVFGEIKVIYKDKEQQCTNK